jgi:hypothetical protein
MAGFEAPTDTKPPRPVWMNPETFQSLPDSLRLREIRVRVTQAGFRTRTLIVVTTLLEPAEYTHDDLATASRHE